MSRARRRARRAKKKQAGARRTPESQRLGRSTEAALAEAYARLAQYVSSASSFEEAAAAARVDLRAAADEIVRLAYGLDLIKAVSGVHVGMIMNNSAAGIEWSAAALELIALVLICRDSSTSAVSAPGGESKFMPPDTPPTSRNMYAAIGNTTQSPISWAKHPASMSYLSGHATDQTNKPTHLPRTCPSASMQKSMRQARTGRPACSSTPAEDIYSDSSTTTSP